MPALAKPPVRIPRFRPHARAGANAGAGAFSSREAVFATSAAVPRPQSGGNSSGLVLNHPKPNHPKPDHPGPDRLALDRLAHDARNILSGLRLYCDLLAAPGVLVPEHRHYAPELEGITKAATEIVEKILACAAAVSESHSQVFAANPLPIGTPAPLAPAPVADAAAELRRLGPLLAAIAGPSVRLAVDAMPCPGLTALSVEDLTRVLVNLVRNAADAMPAGGRIRVTAQYGDGLSFFAPVRNSPSDTLPGTPPDTARACGISAPRAVLLTVADNGPGIPTALRERVFDLGFTTRAHAEQSATGRDWPAPRRRGLGLNIVRGLVEAVGGAIRVASQTACGARFEVVLPILNPAAPGGPITSGTYPNPLHSVFPAARPRKGA